MPTRDYSSKLAHVMSNVDTLGVADYWDTVDYLERKADEKHRKGQREREPGHTPISTYVNAETAYFIKQFKSPRAADTGPSPSAKSESML